MHEGETIRINNIEISGISGYSVYSYAPGYGNIYMDFRHDSDLYSINENDIITINAVVSQGMIGTLRLTDCVLIDSGSPNYGYVDDAMSSEYGLHSKMDDSSTIGFGLYTSGESGFTLSYYGTDTTGYNMIFSTSTPYSNSSNNGTVILFYDSVGNSLTLTVVTPGTISISCSSSTFEGVNANSLDGTYYITESYINPAA